jgi:pimeloyl-ACP methyl ester carboxylesterase
MQGVAMMIPRDVGTTCLAWCLAVCWTCDGRGGEQPFQLECRDGFVLDGMIAEPDGDRAGQKEKVVILLHGSGPQSMDEDLTAVTEGGKKNLWFKEISDALAGVGFTVVRYHKRTQQCNLKIAEDSAYIKSEEFQGFTANWLKLFVDDAVDCARYVQTTRPEAGIYFLGHSQGSYVALQAAHQLESIRGVALIGFYLFGVETALMEQTVYRPMGHFRNLDVNGDDTLDADELAVEDPVAAQLRPQVPVVDSDGDGTISDVELKAGNLSNLLVIDLGLAAFTRQEATYPRQADILRDAEFKVIFLQGLWDNQTPAYHAKAVELAARHVWKKENFRFTWFPELGHALDRRDSYEDITYDTIDDDAKQQLARQLQEFF